MTRPSHAELYHKCDGESVAVIGYRLFPVFGGIAVERVDLVAIREAVAVGVRIVGVSAVLVLFEVGETVAVEIEHGVEGILAIETGMQVLEPVGYAVQIVIRERREDAGGQGGPVLIEPAEQVATGLSVVSGQAATTRARAAR